MNENEWLVSKDPAAMLRHLDPEGPHPDPARRRPRPAPPSDRKLRLWIEACREHAEKTFPEWRWKWTFLKDDNLAALVDTWAENIGYDVDSACPLSVRADLLREIVGNPFRPVTYKWNAGQLCEVQTAHHGMHLSHTEYLDPVPWLTPTVLEMAQHAYDTRDFSGLPYIADALEEAGCQQEALLRHLRGYDTCPQCLGKPHPVSPKDREVGIQPGSWLCGTCHNKRWVGIDCVHVRGCWALDLILGNE